MYYTCTYTYVLRCVQVRVGAPTPTLYTAQQQHATHTHTQLTRMRRKTMATLGGGHLLAHLPGTMEQSPQSFVHSHRHTCRHGLCAKDPARPFTRRCAGPAFQIAAVKAGRMGLQKQRLKSDAAVVGTMGILRCGPNNISQRNQTTRDRKPAI